MMADLEDDFETPLDDALEHLEARLGELEAEVEQLKSADHSGGRTNAAVGYTMGMALAMILSWSRNVSMLWCIVHGLFSWLYVIYFAFTR